MSEQAKEAYRHLKFILDWAVANNVAYYEMIEELQEDHKEFKALLHANYKKKYEALSEGWGFEQKLEKFASHFQRQEFLLNRDVEEERAIAKLLEEENNNLRDKLNALKSSSNAVATFDEGHFFLEAENARLMEELEALKITKSTSSSRARNRPGRGTTDEARTQQTLSNQAV